MDRRISSVPVENDRRKGSRRVAEIEAAKDGKEVVPDWMEQVLAEAAQRQQEMPAMSPPPVDALENRELEQSYEENRKQDYNFEIGLIFFLIVSIIAVFYIFFAL